MILPHGGKLIDRLIPEGNPEGVKERARTLPKIILGPRELSDLEMIAIGGFSPLEGFMNKQDYLDVLEKMRLVDGTVWTIPTTLSVKAEDLPRVKGDEIVLVSQEKELLGLLELEEIFPFDKEKEARLVYGTTDEAHPGVWCLKKMGDFLLGGRIRAFPVRHRLFLDYRLPPARARDIFKEKGWRRIAGFQTRNPIHRAHEYIQKCALEVVDGLFIHPIVGEVKEGDLPAETRMKAYEVLIEKYYPEDRVLLGVNPASMRYAGPREAIFHALIRKNYGCTHFIVGRDHAGVGNYYGPFDAQYIFDEFDISELGITPLFFDNTFYCKQCEGMASPKTCPHAPEEHLVLSGTRVREMLEQGIPLPEEFTRPEVAQVLAEETRK